MMMDRGNVVMDRAVGSVGGRRVMPIMAALEWAFGRECASIDFDDNGSGASRVGVSPVWVMMQRGQLGCQIDGGGRSAVHHDAEVIAILLEAMPHELGGKAMAVTVAALARAGIAPDWMRGAKPRCLPVAWMHNRHGTYGKSEVVETITTVHRGKRLERKVLAVPVTFRPTHAQISAARQRYLDWWGALLWLRQEVEGAGLQSVEVTRAMPPMEPWMLGAKSI